MSEASRYLLDTMVLSEPMKSRPDSRVLSWFSANVAADMYLSVITIGEIERGILKIGQSNPPKAAGYRQKLDEVMEIYAERVLPVGVAIIRQWGRLTFELKHTNPDILIAATALAHDLTLVTRNTRHFAPTGVRLFNPYAD